MDLLSDFANVKVIKISNFTRGILNTELPEIGWGARKITQRIFTPSLSLSQIIFFTKSPVVAITKTLIDTNLCPTYLPDISNLTKAKNVSNTCWFGG
jgi:hypothetical protein